MDRAISARAYYRHHSIDLLTGESTASDISHWIAEYQLKKLSTSVELPRVIHLFYELGFLIEKEFHVLSDETLLAIDIQFSSFNEIKKSNFKEIKLKAQSAPVFNEYKKAFDKGYEELLKGNCYQFNLTFPYLYSFNDSYTPDDFIFSLWRKAESRGAFGSATYIPFYNKLFLSNSPECLFQYKKNILSSMPIKGTLLRTKDDDWRVLWKQLISDKKSQAELFMISDLVRNDLSRIEHPRASIVKKKFPKLVPGLLHQCSQIDVELSDEVTLWKVIEKVFPGGSITGAPKNRVMKLLRELESVDRGFYCGSTIILHLEMKSASINIRSSTIDFQTKKLTYQAGGGITLLSDAEDEFLEMTYKRNSFISSLTL